MAYSIISTVGNGTSQYAISFTMGFNSRSEVQCRVNEEVDGLGDPVYKALTWINDGLVEVADGPYTSDDDLVFTRTVDKTELAHDYSDGEAIEERNLDESNKQAMMAIHEVLDGRLDAPLANDLDMGGFRIINMAEAEDDNDAMTYEQGQAILDSIEAIEGAELTATQAAEDATQAYNDVVAAIVAADISPEIDVFMVGGQSNAHGYSESLTNTVTLPTGVAYKYQGSLQNLTAEPVAFSNGGWMAMFAKTYYEMTGRKVCLVIAAYGGTYQYGPAAVLAGAGTNHWDTGGVYAPQLVSRANSCITDLISAGFTPKLKGVLWVQGEADASGIDSGWETKANYKTALTNMIAYYRAATIGGVTNTQLPFWLSRTGASVSGDTSSYQQIRAAQEEVCQEGPYNHVMFNNAIDFITRGSGPAYMMASSTGGENHYNQAAYNEMGAISAANVVTGSLNANGFQRGGSKTWGYGDANLYYSQGGISVGSTSAPPTKGARFVGGVISRSAANNSAAAGVLGEYIESSVLIGAAVSCSSGSAVDVTSITLTEGDWDITATIHHKGGASTTLGALYPSIGTVSAAVDNTLGRFLIDNYNSTTPFASSSFVSQVFAPSRVTVPAGTTVTYYLTSYTTFGVSTLEAFGILSARRQ